MLLANTAHVNTLCIVSPVNLTPNTVMDMSVASRISRTLSKFPVGVVMPNIGPIKPVMTPMPVIPGAEIFKPTAKVFAFSPLDSSISGASYVPINVLFALLPQFHPPLSPKGPLQVVV